MTFDWQSLSDVDPDDLDAEQVDELTAHLIEVKEDSINEIDSLRNLFSIARSIIQFKCAEADELKATAKSTTNESISSHVSSGEERVPQEMMRELEIKLEERENIIQETQLELKQVKKFLEITTQEKDMITGELEILREELSRKEESEDLYSENRSYLEKIREKNSQITGLLDELKQLEDDNSSLTLKVTRLSSSLNRATYEMEVSTEEMNRLRDNCRSTLEMNKKLLKEKESLLSRLKSLKDKVEYYEEEDLSSKLTSRIDQVIDMIEERDSEIHRLKKQLSSMKMSPVDDTLSPLGKTSVNVSPSNLTLDSMTQGNVLRSYLEDAARVMDEQNELIESLKDQICKSRSESTSNLSDVGKLMSKSDSRDDDDHQTLEIELAAKDSEIIELRKQLFIYENQNFGLKEATAELKKASEREQKLQDKLQETTNQLNQLHMQLTDAEDELDYIRECAKMKGIESDSVPRNKDARQDKLEILKLQQQLIQVEEEKITLQERVRSSAKSSNDQEWTAIKDEDGDDSLLDQVRELKEENAALELGMKEILLAIQRTDSKSDSVVDCPTLERLCQVLESRAVSSSLGPIIALKAELDLVRGNNEQLRTELKRIRQEHLTLLAIYTEEILASTDMDRSNASQSQIFEQEPSRHESSHSLSVDEHADQQASLKELTDGETRQQSSQSLISPTRQEEGPIRTSSADVDDEATDSEQDEIVQVKSPDLQRGIELHATVEQAETEREAAEETNDADDQPQQRKLNELIDAQIQVDLVPSTPREVEKRDSSTITEDTHESTIRPSESDKLSAVNEKNMILCRTIEQLMSRLKCLEDKINSADEETREKISRLTANQIDERESLEKRQLKLEELIKQKDSMIDRLKKQLVEGVPKVRSNRRETHVLTRSDFDASSSSSSPAIFALANAPSALVSSAAHANQSSNLANVVEGVIECLESRIEHKEAFIKQYEERIREAKNSFELEVDNVISRLQVTRSPDASSQDSLKAIMENETLKSRLRILTACLNESREESRKKISQLEVELEEEKKRASEAQASLETAKKRSSFNQVVSLRNEVNQYKEELSAKESLIESLHKRLKEERRVRLAHTRVKVKEGATSDVSASTMTSFVDHLKSQLESKEKQIKQMELSKWTSEKKYQDKVQDVERKLDHAKKENARLEETVKRLKFILEKKKIAVTPPQEKVSRPIVDSSSAKQDARKSTKSNLEEDTELKTLLQESYTREKVAALRLISANAPEIDLEQELLKENARLKVELRMAEFKKK